jgi:hypothetical protein
MSWEDKSSPGVMEAPCVGSYALGGNVTLGPCCRDWNADLKGVSSKGSAVMHVLNREATLSSAASR